MKMVLKKTISYPKYLMELHINKYLDEDDTVDHIDGNIKNFVYKNKRYFAEFSYTQYSWIIKKS